jgi:hypothetical protein
MEFCRICTIVPCDFTHHYCCDSHSASQLVRMSISVHTAMNTLLYLPNKP